MSLLSILSITSSYLLLLGLCHAQQLVRPLGRDRRCRGEIVFQKKPADLDDPENFLNSTSFSEIDCAVKCWQRVPGCRGVRYDHSKNVCMYSSKDQGNCFRTDAEPKVAASDRMLTMYCIQCIEKNQTARTERPNGFTAAASIASDLSNLSRVAELPTTIGGVVVVVGNNSSTTTTGSAPLTNQQQQPKFAGQQQLQQLGPQNQILDEIDAQQQQLNSIGGTAEKLPVVAQQQREIPVQGQPIAAAPPGQAAPSSSAPGAAPHLLSSVQPILPPTTIVLNIASSSKPVEFLKTTIYIPDSSGTTTTFNAGRTQEASRPTFSPVSPEANAVQNKSLSKSSRRPLTVGRNQTAEYEYYYSDTDGEYSSITPRNFDDRNNNVLPANKTEEAPSSEATINNTVEDSSPTLKLLLVTTLPTVRKINALPVPAETAGDAFASIGISDNKTLELSLLSSKAPEPSLSTSTSSPTVTTPSSFSSINFSTHAAGKSQIDDNSTIAPIEVTVPPESVQVLHTFNETSGSFGNPGVKGSTENPLLIKPSEASIRDSQLVALSNVSDPSSLSRITGQLNPIDLSSVTADPSCREEDVLPCSRHVGRECIVVKPGRCPLCFCPYRSPAKGCAGPSGLSDVLRNELIQGKRNCPNGQPAQTVFRYERKIDKEKKFDNCIRTVQPYCGPEQDLFWQMPRFVNDCYYYCYTDKELRARGFVNITTYDKRL